MKNFKFLSALALTGMLTTSIVGTSLAATDVESKTLDVYKKLVDGSTVVPFVLANKDDIITPNDIKTKYTNVEAPEAVKTGDEITVDGTKATAVVYGDINKDGSLNVQDVTLAAKVSAGNATLEDKVQIAAGDVANNDKAINVQDVTRLAKFSAGNSTTYVDEPQKEIEELDLNLMVKKEIYDVEDSVVQAIDENETTSEITMRVIPENVTTRKKAEFTLLNVPAGTTISGEHITGGEVSSDGELKVTVSNETLPGDYTFTITSDGKVKNVTLHVLNATMGGTFSIEKLFETSDMNQVNEEVRKSMQVEEVDYTDITETVSSLDWTEDEPVQYSMNINKLTETTVENETAKHFVVKVRLDEDYKFYYGDELVAVNRKTGKKYITQHSTTEVNSYFVYLDAKELSSDIVIANKNSTEAQITSEQYTDNIVIAVDSSDAILRTVKNDDGKPEISKLQNSVNGAEIKNNQNDTNIKAKVSLDENKFNTIDLYVKSDLLQKYSLGEGFENYGSHNWIGIDFQIVVGGLYNTKEDKVTITANNGAVAGVIDDKLNVSQKKNKKIAAWLPADFSENDSYMKSYTIHVEYYDEDLEEEEETDVTINVYNAGYVFLKSVEAGNEATAKVLESAVVCPTPKIGIQNNSVYMQNININVKKNGMTPTKYNPKTGKYDTDEHLWVYLKLSYNVPYDWVVWNGSYDGDQNKGPVSGTTHSSSNSHSEINTDGEHNEYSEFVWFDLNTKDWSTSFTTDTYNKAIYATERAICNKYGLKSTESYDVDMTTNVRLIFDDYSDTATMFNHLEYASWADANIDFSRIKGVDIEGIETQEVQAEIRKAINNKYVGIDGTEQQLITGTWKDLLEDAVNEQTGNKKLGVLSGTYGNLTINGTKGRWMLAYLSVRNAEAITTEDNETYILDWEDSAGIGGNLYRQGETGDKETSEIPYGRFALVPVWINLDSKNLLKSNLKVNDKTNEYCFNTLTLNSDYDKDGEAEEKNEINVIIKVEEENK